MINFLLLNLPVLFFSIVAMRLWFGYLVSGADRALGVMLIYFSYIIVALEILGLLNLLTLSNLLGLNVLILLLILLMGRFRREGKDLIRAPRIELVSFSFNRTDYFMIMVILSFALVKIYLNLVNPPMGWDSLNYHFTFAVEWLKHGNLDTPLVIGDNPCPTYYPINGSLIYLWYMLPLRNVFLADLGQTPFFVLAFLAAYGIARKLGAPRPFSFWAAACAAIVPNYFRQLAIAYVDIMVSAWFLAALNFLLNYYKKPDLKNTLLFGFSLGMLLGTKTIALAYSLILVVFFLWFLAVNKEGVRKFGHFSIFCLSAAFTSIFSYARNFIQTDNPLYPLTWKIFDKEIFRGVMDKASFTVFARPQDYSLIEILFHEGLGGGILLIVIPGLFLFLFVLLKKRRVLLEEATLAVSFILLYLFYRYAFSLPNVRYLYPMGAIGFIISFTSLSALNFPLKALRGLVGICLLSCIPEMARGPELAISLGASLVLFILFWAGRRFIRKHAIKLLLLSAGLFTILLVPLNADYNKNEFKRYAAMAKYSGFWPDAVKAWNWLNENTTGNNIAYVGRPVPFPLYGEKLKNNVYYVSVNRINPAVLHKFTDSYYRWGPDFMSLHENLEADNNYRGRADYFVWLENLKKRKSDFLFVYSLHQTRELKFPREDDWALAHPEIFLPVFVNPTIHIYKMMR